VQRICTVSAASGSLRCSEMGSAEINNSSSDSLLLQVYLVVLVNHAVLVQSVNYCPLSVRVSHGSVCMCRDVCDPFSMCVM
jgi:hypothetical protein